MCKIEVLKKYLENFQKEIVYTDIFEIKRQNSKYIKYSEYYEQFNTNAFLLAQNSKYFNNYVLFCSEYKYLSKNYIKNDLMLFSLEKYYEYYTTIVPITFAVNFSIDLIIKKDFIRVDTNVFRLNQDYKNFLTLYIAYRIYDTVDIDKFFQTRFYKKRLLNVIIGDMDYIISSNKFLIIEIYTKELILNNKNLLNKIEKIFMKIIWIIEEILISLCVGLPYQTARLEYKANHKGMFYIENNIEIENTIETIEMLENNSKNLKQIKSEVKEESLEKSLINQSVKEKELKVGERVKYTLFPTKYLVFSKQLIISRDISQHIHTKPGLLYKNKLKFDNISYSHYLYAYNTANNYKTCKFKFNIDIISRLNMIPITFSKILFNEILKHFLTFDLKKKKILNEQESIFSTLNEIFKEKDKVSLYFPYLVDSRGRIYIKSPLSITNNKVLRYIIELKYTKIIKNKYYNTFIKHLKLLEKLNNYVNCINKFSEEKQIIVLVGLLNLGKINKVYLTKENNVSLQQFIEEGIKIYNDPNNLLDETIDNVVEIKTLKLKIKLYIEQEKQFSIVVDSTASGIFHLNLWLNLKEKNLKYINIEDREVWWDTYLSFFKITKALMGDKFPFHLENLFTRKRLKSLYMTLPYNAKQYTLSIYFYEGMTREEREKIKPYISNFIKAISETFDYVFYKEFKNLNKIDYFQGKFCFELFGNFYDFYYYHTTKKQKEVIVNKQRLTATETVIKNEANIVELGAKDSDINLLKTKTAFAANVMHCSDAMFLNLIYNKLYENDIYIHTIHDEFIIPVYAYFYFIEIANDVYMEMYYKINNKHIISDSLFIVI